MLKAGRTSETMDTFQIHSRKTRITQVQENTKSRSEEKVMGFSSAFLFTTRKWETVIQGGNMEPGG